MKTEKELATVRLYNRVIFYVIHEGIDLTDFNAIDLYEKFAIDDYYEFEEWLSDETLDEDELSDYCNEMNFDYLALHKKLEDQGFDLV